MPSLKFVQPPREIRSKLYDHIQVLAKSLQVHLVKSSPRPKRPFSHKTRLCEGCRLQGDYLHPCDDITDGLPPHIILHPMNSEFQFKIFRCIATRASLRPAAPDDTEGGGERSNHDFPAERLHVQSRLERLQKTLLVVLYVGTAERASRADNIRTLRAVLRIGTQLWN